MRHCCGSPAKPAGSATPTPTYGISSTPCPSNPATPHDSTHRPRPSSGRSPPWPVTPACDTSLRTDDVWAVDPTPIEYGHSRETTRHAPPGPGRLHLSTATAPPTPRSPAAPRPRGIATGRVRMTGAKATERHIVVLGSGHHHQVTIADKNHHGRESETTISTARVQPGCSQGAARVQPGCSQGAARVQPSRPRARFLRPLRQTIESNLDTTKGAARPRRTRRTHHHRCRRPGLPPATRPDRRDRAQPPPRPTRPTITLGPRPLATDLGINHPGAAPSPRGRCGCW